MNDGRVGDGVEGRESGCGTDWTVEEDWLIVDSGRRGGGRNLDGKHVRREEVTLVCGEVVVDSETSLA